MPTPEFVIANHGLSLKYKTGTKPNKSFMDKVLEEHTRRTNGVSTPVAISKHEFDRLLWKL